MNSELFWLIVGMGVVTFLPRLLPFVLFRGKELPVFLQGVLKNVPAATLGALIFPGVLLINEDIWFGILGVATAAVISFFGANVVLVVLGSIAVLSVYSFLL